MGEKDILQKVKTVFLCKILLSQNLGIYFISRSEGLGLKKHSANTITKVMLQPLTVVFSLRHE